MDSRTFALENEKIGKLLFSYSIPAIIASTASSLYNIIDRMFIGQGVGAYAISGLALTFPIMNLSAAFGTLVGAGAASIVSIRMGEKRNYEATRVLGNAFILNIIRNFHFLKSDSTCRFTFLMIIKSFFFFIIMFILSF